MKGFKKYFIVLIITAAVFTIAWYLSIYFNQRKIEEIKQVQTKVTTDILASETQFDLLQEMSCENTEATYLSSEISELADKISYGELHFSDQTELSLLKQQYSVLEVKDYLLTKRVSARCKEDITTILYFYADKDSCADCVSQGYVLDALRSQYPGIRVYSFDARLDSSTIRALLSIYKVSAALPSIVLNDKTHNGFVSLADLKKMLPVSVTAPTKQTPATSALKVKSPSTKSD
ncbi:MAG: thioredoxin family protein [Patescibacteria group bacterium]